MITLLTIIGGLVSVFGLILVCCMMFVGFVDWFRPIKRGMHCECCRKLYAMRDKVK